MSPKPGAFFGGLFVAPQPHSQGQQIHQPGAPLPIFAPPAWPLGGFDPRGYQPGYDPATAPGVESNPFSGFAFLSLGPTTATPEQTISFGGELAEKLAKAGEKATPAPWVLTLVPSSDDIQALGGLAGTLQFYFKIEYVFPAQYPNYIEGSFSRAGTANGFQPLSIRGIKYQLRNWAVKITVKAAGTGASADWAGKRVRIDAFLSPGALPAGAAGNILPRPVDDPDGFLPEFSWGVSVPTPNGVVGGTFLFKDLAEVTIPQSTFPLGSGVVPIPPNAHKIVSATVGVLGLFYLF